MPDESQPLGLHQVSYGDREIIKQLTEIKHILVRERVIVIKVECCCSSNPVPPSDQPPAAPAAPILEKGETRTMISYPVTMPVFVEADTAKSTLHWTENSGPEQTQDFTTSAATGSLVVNDGAQVEVWATVSDRAGNQSDPSPHVSIASAADTTPPAAPAAPTVGAGQTDTSAPPVLGKGKKVK